MGIFLTKYFKSQTDILLDDINQNLSLDIKNIIYNEYIKDKCNKCGDVITDVTFRFDCYELDDHKLNILTHREDTKPRFMIKCDKCDNLIYIVPTNLKDEIIKLSADEFVIFYSNKHYLYEHAKNLIKKQLENNGCSSLVSIFINKQSSLEKLKDLFDDTMNSLIQLHKYPKNLFNEMLMEIYNKRNEELPILLSALVFKMSTDHLFIPVLDHKSINKITFTNIICVNKDQKYFL